MGAVTRASRGCCLRCVRPEPYLVWGGAVSPTSSPLVASAARDKAEIRIATSLIEETEMRILQPAARQPHDHALAKQGACR